MSTNQDQPNLPGHATPPTIDFSGGAADDAGGADGYQPGACNIGPDEIAARQRSGVAGVVAAGLLGVALLAAKAPPAARLLVALPLAGGVMGLLQARSRFCAAYGMRGVRNFGPLGETTTVDDDAARAADQRRSRQLMARSAAVGLAGGVALALLRV
jgi:hypothetical protein